MLIVLFVFTFVMFFILFGMIIPSKDNTYESGLFLNLCLAALVASGVTYVSHSASKPDDYKKTLVGKSLSSMFSDNKPKSEFEKENKILMTELKKKSKDWLNSFDNENFSTYELYLLNSLQQVTKVKVYNKALILQDEITERNKDSFKESLFEAKKELLKIQNKNN